MNYITLNNGVTMPQLGYGVYQVSQEECERCVLDALQVGYRSIDTAQSYFNEEQVGTAIEKSRVDRKDIFLTTKVWVEHYGYKAAKASVLESLRKLRTDYLDLCLLHQPFADYYGAWHALEELYEAGKIRAIGVSNFYPDRLVDLCSFARIKPMVNQVEVHPLHQQGKAKEWMEKYGVQMEAWPLWRRSESDVHKPCAGGNRRKIRQNRGTGHSPLAFAAGRGGHPKIHPQGADAGKSGSVRLYAVL